MTLYLLRHAEAEVFAPSDSVRRLTSKGEAQATRLGKFCKKHGIEPSVILTSPLLRARGTAELVAKEIATSELIEVEWAACGMTHFEALEELRAYKKFDHIMLVGHQPDLALLISRLLNTANATTFRVRKALLTGIEFEEKISEGSGILQFFLPVKFV